MAIDNLLCVFNTYSYAGHSNQLGYHDIYFVDARQYFVLYIT